MIAISRHRNRTLAVIGCALAVAVAAVVLTGSPARSDVPAGTQVGFVTYGHIFGTSDVTQEIRSFAMKATVPVVNQQTDFAEPVVVQGADGTSPLFMRSIAQGLHMPTIRVVLFSPGTSTRQSEWTFTDAQLIQDSQVKSSPNPTPAETVSWTFRQVTQAVYKADGATVIRSYCFDVELNSAC